MSAPDPKAWEEPDDDPEILAFAYRIARRRALEELKALSESATEEPNRLPICPVWTVRLEDIRARIAAIEAEES